MDKSMHPREEAEIHSVKVRLVSTLDQDELHSENNILRTKIAQQTATIQHALEANNGLAIRLSVVEAELKYKDALLSDRQDLAGDMPGGYSDITYPQSAADNVIKDLKATLCFLGRERVESEQITNLMEINSTLVEESTSRLTDLQTVLRYYEALQEKLDRSQQEKMKDESDELDVQLQLQDDESAFQSPTVHAEKEVQTKEIPDPEDELRQKEEALAIAEERCSKLSEEITKQRFALENALQDSEDLRIQIRERDRLKSKLERDVKDLKDELETAREESRKNAMQVFEIQLNTFKEEIKILKNSRDAFEEQLGSREREVRELKAATIAKATAHNVERRELEDQVNKLCAEQKERVMKTRFDGLQTSFDEQLRKIQGLEKELNDKDEQYRSVLDQLEVSEACRKDHDQKLADALKQAREMLDYSDGQYSHLSVKDPVEKTTQKEAPKINQSHFAVQKEHIMSISPRPGPPITVQSQTHSDSQLELNNNIHRDQRSPSVPYSSIELPFAGLKKSLRFAPKVESLTKRKYALHNSHPRQKASSKMTTPGKNNSIYQLSENDSEEEDVVEQVVNVKSRKTSQDKKGKGRAADKSSSKEPEAGSSKGSGNKDKGKGKAGDRSTSRNAKAPKPGSSKYPDPDPSSSDSGDSDGDGESAGGGGDGDDDDGGDGDDDDDDDSDKDDEESNKPIVADKWKLKHVQKRKYKNNINNMTCDLYQTALNLRDNHDVLRRDYPSVTSDRLHALRTGNVSAGPMLVNTTLHWRGLTVDQMRTSEWNGELIHKLCVEARRIVSQHKDGRFGNKPIDFESLFKGRFNKLYKYIDNFRQREGETAAERATRLKESYHRRQSSTRTSGLKSWKYDTRLSITGIMLEFSRDTNDKEGEQFWSYALDALLVLGKHGMSDEEDGEEEVLIDGVRTTQDIKKVSVLWFRHESFRTLFKRIDETPKSEVMIFTQQGRVSVKRVRSNIIDRRDPPKGLPEDIFRSEYLEGLLPHQRKKFRISTKKRFEIAEIDSN